MKLFRIAMCAALLLGLMALPLMAADTPAAPAPADHPMAKLTPEQRAAVRALMEKFHLDMVTLRADLRTAVDQLKDLRKSGADETALKAQREVVKTRIEAVHARIVQLLADLKPLVPPDVRERIADRVRDRIESIRDFMENHPGLRGEKAAPDAAK
jgi:hypothetical protein